LIKEHLKLCSAFFKRNSGQGGKNKFMEGLEEENKDLQQKIQYYS